MDCLLLHIPKFSSVYLPLGEFLNITYMPMGLPALANQLQADGFDTQIRHFGVEWLVDPERALVDEVAREDVRLIGADFYWHYQTFDVLDVAERIKAQRPDVFFFLGGTTAGYFASQIMADYPFIDAIVRGDGEQAVSALADAVLGDGDMRDVPNTVWRAADGTIVTNPVHRASDQAAIDRLVFGDLSLLRHRDVYVESFGFPLAYPKQFDKARNDRTQKMGDRAFFPLFVGRGCAWDCTFCGGNRKTLRTLHQTPTLRWRDLRRVVDDVELALDHGYKTMALCFDPTPERDDYYVEMFAEIRRRKLDVDFYFECWGLPTERFLDEWVRTFGADNPHSYLALSPDCGDEGVRKINKQPYYTNAQLFSAMDMMQERGVTADVFFTIALPGETLETALKTRDLNNEIRERYTIHKRLMTWSVQLEPGSAQFERPETFNMITDRRTVQDYYDAHGGGADTYSALGYKINDYFGDERDRGSIQDFEAHIQALKCMEFCFFGEDPTQPMAPQQGRDWCRSRRQEIADFVGLDQVQKTIDADYRYADAARDLAAAFPTQRPRYR